MSQLPTERLVCRKQCELIIVTRPRKSESVAEDSVDSCGHNVFTPQPLLLWTVVEAPLFTSTEFVLAVSLDEPDGALHLCFNVHAVTVRDESLNKPSNSSLNLQKMSLLCW